MLLTELLGQVATCKSRCHNHQHFCATRWYATQAIPLVLIIGLAAFIAVDAGRVRCCGWLCATGICTLHAVVCGGYLITLSPCSGRCIVVRCVQLCALACFVDVVTVLCDRRTS